MSAGVTGIGTWKNIIQVLARHGSRRQHSTPFTRPLSRRVITLINTGICSIASHASRRGRIGDPAECIIKGRGGVSTMGEVRRIPKSDQLHRHILVRDAACDRRVRSRQNARPTWSAGRVRVISSRHLGSVAQSMSMLWASGSGVLWVRRRLVKGVQLFVVPKALWRGQWLVGCEWSLSRAREGRSSLLDGRSALRRD